jgi:hypothetical protein
LIVRSEKIVSVWSGFLQNISRERKEESSSFWRGISSNQYVQCTCHLSEKLIDGISRFCSCPQSANFLIALCEAVIWPWPNAWNRPHRDHRPRNSCTNIPELSTSNPENLDKYYLVDNAK